MAQVRAHPRQRKARGVATYVQWQRAIVRHTRRSDQFTICSTNTFTHPNERKASARTHKLCVQAERGSAYRAGCAAHAMPLLSRAVQAAYTAPAGLTVNGGVPRVQYQHEGHCQHATCQERPGHGACCAATRASRQTPWPGGEIYSTLNLIGAPRGGLGSRTSRVARCGWANTATAGAGSFQHGRWIRVRKASQRTWVAGLRACVAGTDRRLC